MSISKQRHRANASQKLPAQRAEWFSVLARSSPPNRSRPQFSFVREQGIPQQLSEAEFDGLKKAAGDPIDDRFVMACRLAVDTFIAHRAEFARYRDGEVKKRLDAVLKSGIAFLRAQDALDGNERYLIDLRWTTRFLANQSEPAPIREVIKYLRDVEAVRDEAADRAKRVRRTPDFAAQWLAVEIQSALKTRDGALPPLTRKKSERSNSADGVFARTLKWALEVAALRRKEKNDRADVMPLMRHARDELKRAQEEAEATQSAAFVGPDVVEHFCELEAKQRGKRRKRVTRIRTADVA